MHVPLFLHAFSSIMQLFYNFCVIIVEKCIAGVHPDNVESMEEEESDDDGKSSQFESDDDEEPQVLISELETGVPDEEEESCNDGKLDQERKITEEENISGIKGNSDNKQGPKNWKS